MSVDTLRCRVCERRIPAIASGICLRCFGPLEPVYDWDAVARVVSREQIEAGPRSLWRYEALLPTPPPADAGGGPGWTPLVQAPRLAHALGIGELYLKLDHTNPTHSFKDRVVAVAAAKAAELGADTLACASTGNLGNAVAARAAASGMRSVVLYPETVEPEKLLATAVYGGEMYAVPAPTTTARGSSSSWPASSTGRSSTSTCARTTRRARRRSRSRSASSSAGSCRTRSSRRSPRARSSRSCGRGSTSSGGSAWSRATSPRIYGGQAEGCSPVAARIRGRPPGLAGAARDGRALARDRRAGRRRPRDRDGARVGRRDLRRAGGRRRREHVAARRDVRRLRRDRRGRHDRRAPRRGRRRRDRRARSRRRADHRLRPEDTAGGRVREGTRIAADVDALLAGLGVRA